MVRNLSNPRAFQFLLPVALAFGLSVTSVKAEEPAAALYDLTGANCRAIARTDIAPDPQAPSPVSVKCESASHTTGAVALVPLPLALPDAADERHAILERTAAASAAGQNLAGRMACRAGKWQTTSSGKEILIQPCSLVDGNWPYISVIASVGNYLVEADGLPSVLPVLGAWADKLAGAEGGFTTIEQARALLDKAYGGKPPLVGSLDLDKFDQMAETARLQGSRNDYHAMEDSYRQALAIQEKAQGADAPGVGTTLMELALAVSNQRRFDESAALFRRADPIIQRSPNQADQARYYTYLAFDSANAGRYADGLAYAREATNIWRDLAEGNGQDLSILGGEEDSHAAMRGELAHSLNSQAAMALRTGDLAEAESSAKEALEIIGDEPNLPPWWRPEVLVTIGKIDAALGRLNEAEESFRGALVFQQRLFGETAPTAVTLLALAQVYADEGLYGDSVRSYDFAMAILDKDELARSHVVFDQVAPVLTSASAIVEKKPEMHGEMDAKMFLALQLLSSGVADQTIAKASARLAARDDTVAELVRGAQEAERKRDAARIELAHETSLPDEERGADKEKRLLGEVNAWAAEQVRLLNRLNVEYPAFAQLSRPRPMELAQLQTRLQPKEAMVIFQVGRTRAFAVVITRQSFVARSLDIDQVRLDEKVRELRKPFALRGGHVADFDLEGAYALYQTLFSPIEKDLDGVDRLAVVSNGSLSSLPLSLLVTKKPTTGHDYRHTAWLAKRFATADVPSVRAFVSLRDRAGEKKAGLPFLGIGNPAFVGGGDAGKDGMENLSTECREQGPIPAQFLRSLAPLPETAGELRTVAKTFGASDKSLLMGAAANEENFRKLPLSDARVLYFATHGLLPGELSCQSEPALALSPPATPATSKETDGLLDASEIAGLKLNADLVVLSACNTAQSSSKFGGEALSGLAESFFYAGARALIASHWQVPSAATANLMVGMFQRMAADPQKPTSEDLRQSQLVLMDREETAHPFFWAAFTVIGDGGGTPPGPQATIDTAPTTASKL